MIFGIKKGGRSRVLCAGSSLDLLVILVAICGVLIEKVSAEKKISESDAMNLVLSSIEDGLGTLK